MTLYKVHYFTEAQKRFVYLLVEAETEHQAKSFVRKQDNFGEFPSRRPDSVVEKPPVADATTDD